MPRSPYLTYYSLAEILRRNAQYNVIFGQRSNGKTYAVLEHILLTYRDTKKQGAILRRYLDDIMPNKMSTIFDSVISSGRLADVFKSHGGWTGVKYYRRRFYLSKMDADGEKETVDDRPFAYCFALTEEEDYKQNAYPDITTVFFDEFLSRRGYLADEFIVFLNLVSTIKRNRQDVRIFMVGNTISQYCPYFREMGIEQCVRMPLGTIQVYEYGSSGLRVAVQRAESLKKDGRTVTDRYFAFDNPKLRMITQGDWELDIYPHLFRRYRPKDVRDIFFIRFSQSLYQGDIVSAGGDVFVFVHPKTTEIKDPDRHIIYQLDASSSPNVYRRIDMPYDYPTKVISSLWAKDKWCYSDNQVGDAIANYVSESRK